MWKVLQGLRKPLGDLVGAISTSTGVTGEHVTAALMSIGAFGVVVSNWNSSQGFRELLKQATIGASCGYGVASFLRNNAGQQSNEADVGNQCTRAEGILNTPNPSGDISQRLGRIVDVVEAVVAQRKMLHEYLDFRDKTFEFTYVNARQFANMKAKAHALGMTVEQYLQPANPPHGSHSSNPGGGGGGGSSSSGSSSSGAATS